MDFELPEHVRTLAYEANQFARQWVIEHGATDDCWMTGHSPDAAREAGRRGWIGMTIPVNMGGWGRTPLERFVVIEALMSHGVPMADWWFADQLIGQLIVRHGTSEQQRRWIPDIVAGRKRWTIGSAETGAGSDPLSMTTWARPTSGGYLVTGAKAWVLTPSDLCYLICRSEDGSEVFELVVDLASQGVRIEQVADATGRVDFSGLLLEDVYVPEENRIPPSPRNSIRLLRVLNEERGGIDRFVCNRASYLDALRQADLGDPLVRQRVAKIESGYRIGRLLALRTLSGLEFPGYPSLVKILGSEFEQEVADFVYDLASCDGQVWSRDSAQRMYSTCYTMIGGASEVLKSALADIALRLPAEGKASPPPF